MMLFDDLFVLMICIVYLISFSSLLTILIPIMCILLYYNTQDCIVCLTSFFDHHIIVFSRVLLHTILLFPPVFDQYVEVKIYS